MCGGGVGKVFQSFVEFCGIWNAICGAHIWFISFFCEDEPFSKYHHVEWRQFSLYSKSLFLTRWSWSFFELFPWWKFENYEKRERMRVYIVLQSSFEKTLGLISLFVCFCETFYVEVEKLQIHLNSLKYLMPFPESRIWDLWLWIVEKIVLNISNIEKLSRFLSNFICKMSNRASFLAKLWIFTPSPQNLHHLLTAP